MFAAYRQLLTHRGVPHIIGAAILTRLGPPVLSLALLLAVLDKTGSYSAAGLALTSHALALAVCVPIGGRLVDRIGARRVLVGCLIAHTLTYGSLVVVLVTPAPTWILLAGVALVGATNPPASPVIRGMWPRLVPSTSLGPAYAVDNMTNELMFVIGPVLVSLLRFVMPTELVVGIGGAAVLVGAALLIGSRAVRQSPVPSPVGEDSARRLRRLAGPLGDRSTLVLLLIAASGTFTFGCLRIATAASAAHFGSVNAAGLLMGMLSAGTMVGALVYGARAWPLNDRRLLVLACLADCLVLLADAAAPSLLVLTLLIVGTGILTGLRETVLPTLLAQQAPVNHTTEVFAWLNTFMWVGYGLGTVVAGYFTEPADNGANAFIAAAVAALAGAAFVYVLRLPSTGSRD
jgi:MFS family permease